MEEVNQSGWSDQNSRYHESLMHYYKKVEVASLAELYGLTKLSTDEIKMAFQQIVSQYNQI